MTVTLRKKALSNGKYSLYLDLYQDGQRKYEFLKLYTFKRPKDELEKQHNKEIQRLAENIRSKRELQINTQDHGFEPEHKKRVNFIQYFEKFTETYPKKDKRLVIACLQHFKSFVNTEYLKPGEVTEQFCIDFKEYLCQHLNGETPANYFAKFKKLLRQATREKIILVNPAAEVANKKKEGIKKDILSIQEIQSLASAHCGNSEVKRAFLFACVTGLRYCDIAALRWGNINENALKLNQAKTGKPVRINLNTSAIKLLGEPGKAAEAVFNLPSHTGILKVLRYWTKRAGLQKHVTFHVARHSFATNLIIHEADVNTVSSLLGHTSLQHTQKYVRVVEALKEQAVNKLPELNL